MPLYRHGSSDVPLEVLEPQSGGLCSCRWLGSAICDGAARRQLLTPEAAWLSRRGNHAGMTRLEEDLEPGVLFHP